MIIITKSASRYARLNESFEQGQADRDERGRIRESARSPTDKEDSFTILLKARQRKNRFTFYMILLIVCILISFWSGYRLGRTVTEVESKRVSNS